MPATTTLATLLSDIAEELDLGLVISAGTGATGSITETDTGVSELRGPFTGSKIPIGSPVTVITGGTVGEDTYVSNFVSSTGVVSLSPAITTGATGFIIWDAIVKHGKNVEKAISRANQKCRRWQKVPLTFVPNGDFMSATAATGWTETATTAAYIELGHPDGGYQRVLQSTCTNNTNRLTSTALKTVPGDQWDLYTFSRLVSGNAAVLVIYDESNSAAITPTYQVGQAEWGGTSFLDIRISFTIPTDCTSITIRLQGQTSGDVTQWGPVIAYPSSAYSFPFQQRVKSLDDIGNFFRFTTGSGTSSPYERLYSGPFTQGGIEASFSNDGDHFVVSFNTAPCGPMFYDELIHGGALTAMTDTTTFPADMVKLWARAELYDFLMRSDLRGAKRMENGTPLPSVWRPLRNAAYKSARWSQFEPEMANISGRR